MKKIITSLLLVTMLLVSCFSLSSCFLLDAILESEGGTESGGGSGNDTVINVDGGDNYEINITPGVSSDILAASKALLSSVSVFSTFECYQYGWGGQVSGTTEKTSAGSGVIYELDKEKGNAYIITNYHVVYESSSVEKNGISRDIKLFLYGEEISTSAISATYVGGSMQYDLALLKVEASEVLMKSSAMAADIADSNGISVLEKAIAIGNPEGEGISATVGHVNVDSEYITILASDNTTYVQLRVIRTDAAVNSGNSGGGLFNAEGKLIGIVNAKMSDSSIDNIGYAIPSNVVKGVCENIKAHCVGTDKESVYKCMLGVTVVAIEQKAVYDTETGRVIKVERVGVDSLSEGSAVSELLKKDDIINSITIDGVKHDITRLHHVIDSMLYARVGSVIVINITRAGVAQDVIIPAIEKMFVEYK